MEQKQDSPYSEAEKLRWEIEKLKAEVKAQERSPYKNPSLLVAVFTAFLGLAGIWIQYVKSDMAYQLAEIKKEQTMLEIEKLNQQRAETDQLLAKAQQELEATLASYKEKARQYAALQAALTKANEALAANEQKGQSSPAATEAVKKASTLLGRASRSNQAEAQASRKTLEQIVQLRRDVSSPGHKQAPAVKLSGFAYYGLRSGEGWSERNFRRQQGDPAGDPQPGEVVVALLPVNARADLIRYDPDQGWVNAATVGIIRKGQAVRVSEVMSVPDNEAFRWIRFETL